MQGNSNFHYLNAYNFIINAKIPIKIDKVRLDKRRLKTGLGSIGAIARITCNVVQASIDLKKRVVRNSIGTTERL